MADTVQEPGIVTSCIPLSPAQHRRLWKNTDIVWAEQLKEKTEMCADDILALFYAQRAAGPCRAITNWCFANGANGTKAFCEACSAGRFWLANWLVDRGAVPGPWRPQRCGIFARTNRQKWLKAKLLERIGFVRRIGYHFDLYCAAYTEVHEHSRCDMCMVYPILGPRYRCSVRTDYDLCSTCYGTAAFDEYCIQRVPPPITSATTMIRCV